MVAFQRQVLGVLREVEPEIAVGGEGGGGSGEFAGGLGGQVVEAGDGGQAAHGVGGGNERAAGEKGFENLKFRAAAGKERRQDGVGPVVIGLGERGGG